MLLRRVMVLSAARLLRVPAASADPKFATQSIPSRYPSDDGRSRAVLRGDRAPGA